MNRPLSVVVATSLIAAVAAPAPSRSESTWKEEVAASRRALNGHVFATSPFLQSPFSATYWGTQADYAYSSATGPRYDLSGNVIGTRTYTLAGLGNNVHYQKRFADWLALRAKLTGIVYSGVDGRSALVAGATVRSDVGLGLTSAHRIARAVQIAAVFDATFQPAIDLTIAAGIRRAIATGTFDSGEVFVLGRTIVLRPGVSVAWAPNGVFGLQGEVRYVYMNVDKTSSENATGDAVDMSVLGDADLNAVSSVPIGLTIAYRLLKRTSGGLFRIQDVGGGLFYTGRPHLAAGLNLAYQWFHLRPELEANATLAQLLVRYYW